MNIFESKHYPVLMFVLILSVLIITLFSVSNILEKTNKTVNNYSIQDNSMQKNSPISGLVSLKIDTNAPETNSSGKVNSLRNYIFYDVILGVLFLLLYLLIKFIYRR